MAQTLTHDNMSERKSNRRFRLSIHPLQLMEKHELSPLAWLATLPHNEQHIVTWRSDAAIRRCCKVDLCAGDCEVAPDGALIRVERMRTAATTHERHDFNICEGFLECDNGKLIVLQFVLRHLFDAMNTGQHERTE